MVMLGAMYLNLPSAASSTYNTNFEGALRHTSTSLADSAFAALRTAL